MNKIYLILNFFLLTIFILFFSIIGVNKKTIDSFNNKNELETNKKNLRGLLWTNYSLIILTLIFSMFYIFKTGNYINNKPIIIFTILYILLNTGMTVFQEFIISNSNSNSKESDKLKNIYIITSIMNIVYFVTIVKIMVIINKIQKNNDLNLDQVVFNRYVMNYPFSDINHVSKSSSTPYITRNNEYIINEDDIYF